MRNRIAFWLACSVPFCGFSHAQDLQGAKRLIDATREPADTDAPVTEESFAVLIENFQNNSGNLSAEAQAKGWLDLVKTWMKLGRYSNQSPFPALPPVEHWEVLAKEIDARTSGKTDATSGALWLFASVLRGDDVEIKRRIEILGRSWEGNAEAKESLRSFAKAKWPSKEGQIADFKEALNGTSRYIQIPDLKELPPAEAEELLFAAMEKADSLSFAVDETRKAAVAAVLRNPKRLKTVPWGIVGAEDGQLVEMLMPSDYVIPRDDYRSRQAFSYYFVYLVEKREFDKADKIRKQFSPSEFYYFTSGNRRETGEEGRKAMRDYLLRTLREDPSQGFWSKLARTSSATDTEVWEFFKGALDGDRVTGAEQRQEARSEWLDHLFDTGKEADAMEYLRKFIAASTGKELERLLFKQINAAELLGDTATAGQANERLESVIQTKDVDPEFVELELKRGRFVPLEKIAGTWLRNHSPSRSPGTHEAGVLVRLYEAAGKPDEVFTMLDQWPRWGAGDLSDVVAESPPVGMCVARAFAAKGRNEDALATVKEVIKETPGSDEAYTLLLKLAPADCEAYLKELVVKLPFEERPLIWLAQWYSNAGRLDEGEAAIRKAISIDPSDGEMGKGDRMRAYRVLGEIQRKQGKTDEAEFMAKIDKAIRLSENADDWWMAGMTRKALALYDEALRIFGDAYCIQSRLALRYESMGDAENALKHYQRAFELMPDSFGRIESHCFGCEGAFRSETAQGIAEKVFTSLAAKPDAKAQVYYLLGYLRDSQSRRAEATEYFRKAVEKDPDYFNALERLASAERFGGISQEEADRTNARLAELGAESSMTGISDLRLMWKAVAVKERNTSWRKSVETLYPLAASREHLKKAAGKEDENYDTFSSERYRWGRNYRDEIAGHAVIREITRMLHSEMEE